MKEKGNIDTLIVLNELKKSKYKWARSTTRRLFRNEIQAEIRDVIIQLIELEFE